MSPARILPVVLLGACFHGGAPEGVAVPASAPTQATRAVAAVVQHHTVTVDGHPVMVHSKRSARAEAAVVLVHGRTWSGLPLMLPFAKPTGYGLGKSGWVSASFTAKERPPLDLLREWIDESYRAIAPKKLVAALVGARDEERGQTGKQAAGAKAPNTKAPNTKAPNTKAPNTKAPQK